MAFENLASLADIKTHCRIEADFTADDALLAMYQQAAVGEIRQVCDNDTLFDTALTDTADLAALQLFQCLIIADLYRNRNAASPAALTWTPHMRMLADKFHDYPLLDDSDES